MNYRDPRFLKTAIPLMLAASAINVGTALGKIDNGIGTSLTVVATVLGALVVGICLFVLIRDIWKQDA